MANDLSVKTLELKTSGRPLRQSQNSGALLATRSIATTFEILLLYADDNIWISVCTAVHSN